MPTTFNVLFLGNFADIDPIEGTTNFNSLNAENASLLVGETFGSVANPLAIKQSDFLEFAPGTGGFSGSTGTPGSSTVAYNLDNDFGGTEFFTLDGGPDIGFDSTSVYNATITYVDGTTANITAVVFQDLDGNVYLAPEVSANTDQANLEAGPIRSLTLDSLSTADTSGLFADRATWDLTNICFARGTRIKTIKGEVLIEDLREGDRVFTMDAGYQPIRWIGNRKLGKTDLEMNPRLKPIRIRADALGPGLPETDLLVSPQHRVLIRSIIAYRMFDTEEVLVPANKLLTLPGIDIEWDAEEVEYFHMLFDAHQLVWSNGAVTESLFTGPEALKAVSPEAREEIAALFPELFYPDFVPIPARPIPEKGKLMKKLAQRLAKNDKPVQESLSPKAYIA
jgi:hypothetical protein